MKPFICLFLFILPLGFFLTPQAHAEGLLANSCVSLSENQSMAVQRATWGAEELAYTIDGDFIAMGAQTNMLGLNCKDIRAIDQAAFVVGVAISPAVSSLAIPVVRSALAAELAGLGIVIGSPAIATATIIGTFGIVTYKVLMKVSLEKCAEQDRNALKNELFREFEIRYGLQSNPETNFQITR